jgi:ribonuclease HI
MLKWKEMTAYKDSREPFWSQSDLATTCTWQDFKDAVICSAALPRELICSLYNEQFRITEIIGSKHYKDEHGQTH